ncbi:MAG: ABC transporter permease [Candidatus Coatesbacteria bacterium]|nr:ABC transporter permease [Candidatus Coatesbacteria bacterium]
MILKEPILVGLTQLSANKLRSFLTMLGILIGVGSVVGIVSISDGARKMLLTEIDKFGGSNIMWVSPPYNWVKRDGRWQPRAYDAYLDNTDVKRIAGCSEHIVSVLPMIRVTGNATFEKNTSNCQISGTLPSYAHAMDWRPERGRFFSQQDEDSWRKVCVIGDKVYEDLFPDESDPIGRDVRLAGVRCVVIGVMEAKTVFGDDWGYRVLAPLSTVQHRMRGTDRTDFILVTVDNSLNVSKAERRVKSLLKRIKDHGDEYHVNTAQSEIEKVEGALLVAKLITGGIAAISLIVGGVGIMNIMLVSVAERTREIGLRKAVGARNWHIFFQFLIEAIILCILGCVVGIGVGFALGLGIAAAISKAADIQFISVVSPKAILMAVAYSVGIGLAAGVLPAIRAARLNPVEALRYE